MWISLYFGADMHSLQRQREIYINGLAGIRPATPVSYDVLEQKARQNLSPEAFAYLAWSRE